MHCPSNDAARIEFQAQLQRRSARFPYSARITRGLKPPLFSEEPIPPPPAAAAAVGLIVVYCGNTRERRARGAGRRKKLRN